MLIRSQDKGLNAHEIALPSTNMKIVCLDA